MPRTGRPRTFDRDKALESAMKVFWEKGYDSASLPELTKAMGINTPSLYAAFDSKASLFLEAVSLYASRQARTIWAHLDSALPVREAFGAVLHESAREFSRPGEPRGCLVVLAAVQGTTDAQVCAALTSRRESATVKFGQCLERAISRGELPRDVPVGEVAQFYATVQQGMSLQARDGASEHALHRIADTALAGWDCILRSRT